MLTISRCGGLGLKYQVGLFTDLRGMKHVIGLKGVADIVGCTADGRALAVEIKTGAGQLRPEQRTFAAAWQKRRGVWVLARYNEAEDGDATIALALRDR